MDLNTLILSLFLKSIDNIDFQDAIDFYNNYSSPSNAYIVIIGDVNYDEIKSKVNDLFSGWNSKEVSSEVISLAQIIQMKQK